MKSKHSDFQLTNCGLVINGACRICAASPDGVRHCSCHGTGLTEVKCSFKHKDLDVKEIVEIDPIFYLDKELKLKHSHGYYIQVQFQMYVCQVTFCDFLVFTLNGISVHSVDNNAGFVSELVRKCSEFVLNCEVLEILCHKLNNKESVTNICLCKHPLFGKAVLCSIPIVKLNNIICHV